MKKQRIHRGWRTERFFPRVGVKKDFGGGGGKMGQRERNEIARGGKSPALGGFRKVVIGPLTNGPKGKHGGEL